MSLCCLHCFLPSRKYYTCSHIYKLSNHTINHLMYSFLVAENPILMCLWWYLKWQKWPIFFIKYQCGCTWHQVGRPLQKCPKHPSAYQDTVSQPRSEQKKDRREQRNSCSAKMLVDKAVPIKIISFKFFPLFWLFSSLYLRNASDSTNRYYYDYGTCVFKLSIDPRNN